MPPLICQGGFAKKQKLFFHRDGKTLSARGTAHGVLPCDPFEAQGVFAVRTFVIEVRFSVAHLQKKTANRQKELAEKAAKRQIFAAALCRVAREKAEERVGKKKRVECKKEGI